MRLIARHRNGHGRGSRRRPASRPLRRALILAAALSVLFGASLAVAEEITRDEYRARVEPICKRNAEANDEILRGIRTDVRKGRLAVAGQRLIRAAAALRKALTQLRAVPRPPADEARLTDWLEHVSEEASLLDRAGRALKTGKRRLAERLQTRLYSGARLTNTLVLRFEFRYCRFEPSKYV